MISEVFNDQRIKLFEISDGKNIYADPGAYREVVLQRGDETTDIIYTLGAWRARHDRENIKAQLITYGYDEAKKLAEYIKISQANFEKRLKEERETIGQQK